MKDSKKTTILVITIIANFIICDLAIAQQMRNPFKDWLPVKIKQEEPGSSAPAEPIISFEEEEKRFDPGIYTVQGLIWGPSKPKAIINNAIYNLGDKLDEAEIVGIDKEGVTLVFNEEEFVITTKQVININNPDKKTEEIEGVGNEI